MLYDYLCRKCGHETEAINSIAERRTNAPVCCDERMDIIHKAAPQGYVQRECFYRCPVTNSEVTSWRQRRNIMAEKNLIDANDLVNPKTIQESVREKEKLREIADAHRLPSNLKGQFEALPGVQD